VSSLDVTSRKLLSLEFALPFDLWIQLRRGWPIWGDGRLRFHLQDLCDALKLSSLKVRKLREAELRNRRKRRPFNGYNARPLE